MQESISFKTPAHKIRFVAALQSIGKVYEGRYDPEYAAAIFILSADTSTWNKAQGYVAREGIDIETMLKEVDFSGGYSVLMQLAGNLFNDQISINPVELMRLDDSNFKIAIDAIKLRRYGMSAGEV